MFRKRRVQRKPTRLLRRDAGNSTDGLRDLFDRMIRELVLAQEVQRSMLPGRMPEVGPIRFGAALRPCEHLAGDFYNVFRLDHDHIGLYLGDVMGHGAPAALLSVYVMQHLTTKRIEGNAYEILSPSQTINLLNANLLEANFPGEPFVTLIYGVLEVSTLRFTYSNAGHPPACLLSGSEAPRFLESSHPPAGLFETSFTDATVTLQHGDRLVLWSDGVDTLRWPRHGMRGDALAAFLQLDKEATPQQQIDSAFSAAEPLPGVTDDVAMLMMRVA